MSLFLTFGTKVSGALRLYHARDGRFTTYARRTTTIINIEIHLKIPCVAIAIDKVLERATAALNGRLQQCGNVLRQLSTFGTGQCTRGFFGVDAAQKQHFAGVNIAHAHHPFA